jgi:hypothetical protein
MMNVVDENTTKFYRGILTGKGNLGDLGLGGIMLKRILKYA